SERSYKLVSESNVDTATLLQVIRCLLEGVSVRGTERLTGAHRDTILKLLRIAGDRCSTLMAERIRNVPVSQVQVDEIFSYVFKKEKHKTEEESGNSFVGDAYTFVGIEAKTKLVLCFELGKRDGMTTLRFVEKLRKAARGRFQLTSDGFR